MITIPKPISNNFQLLLIVLLFPFLLSAQKEEIFFSSSTQSSFYTNTPFHSNTHFNTYDQNYTNTQNFIYNTPFQVKIEHTNTFNFTPFYEDNTKNNKKHALDRNNKPYDPSISTPLGECIIPLLLYAFLWIIKNKYIKH